MKCTCNEADGFIMCPIHSGGFTPIYGCPPLPRETRPIEPILPGDEHADLFQRCPICEGKGKVPWNPDNPVEIYSEGLKRGPWQCPTCLGQRIISVLSGAPPRVL